MSTETELILEKLGEIKIEIDYIKEHMVDIDLVLDKGDIEALRAADQDFKEGKGTRL